MSRRLHAGSLFVVFSLVAAGITEIPHAVSAANPTTGPRTAVVRTGDLDVVMRLNGTIAAERFAALLVPQLGGSRGGSRSSGGGSSASASSSSTSGSTSGSSAQSSTSTSAASGVGANTALSATPGAASATSSLGALRGTTNRFGDRTPASTKTTSSSSGASSSSGQSAANSTTSGMGSTAGTLNSANQRASFSGNNPDFDLTLLGLVTPGSRVKKGQVVAEFDRQAQMLRLDDYRDSMVQSEASLKKLRAELEVTQKAHNQLIASARADLDKAELDLKTVPVRSSIEAEKLRLAVDEAKAHLKQVQSEAAMLENAQRADIRIAELDRDRSKIELDRATRNVQRMILRAPMDGIAVAMTIYRGGEFGQVRKGDELWPGMEFLQVVDPSAMVMNAVANQVDAEDLRIGMRAEVRLDAYPGLVLAARVTGVGAMTRPGAWRPQWMREIPVKLVLEQMDSRVIPDITASADVHVSGAKGLRLAPRGAVFHDGERAFVMVSTAGGWQRRDVQLGVRNNLEVEIKSGVGAGEVLSLERSPSSQ